MPIPLRDVEEVVSLLLIYLPTAPAKQLLGDLERSRAAEHDASFKETVRRLGAELAERTRGDYSYTRR